MLDFLRTQVTFRELLSIIMLFNNSVEVDCQNIGKILLHVHLS